MKKIFTLVLLFLTSLASHGAVRSHSLVNLNHLNKLYEDVTINYRKCGIIHIYCDYPDYKWTDAADEGITCMDDCVRAAIAYMNEYSLSKNKDCFEKAKRLTRTMMFLQSENGFFYNFLNKDLSINKKGKTSIDEPNWWSWRAIWGLSEAYSFFKANEASFAKEIYPVLHKSIYKTIGWLDTSNTTVIINGYKLPAYLPFQTGSDQTAIIVKALIKYYSNFKDNRIKNTIIRLCNGIIDMQSGDKNVFPYYAFFSWQTSWHAWGNNQSEALIMASNALKEKKYLKAALNEIDNFYNYLININYINEFEIENKDGKPNILKHVKYSQIAYGITPLIQACSEAYKATGNIKYANKAFEISKWYFGGNSANATMYHVSNGGCYDGINDSLTVNKNMGAESTIEALFAMQSLEQNNIIKLYWKSYYNKIYMKND